MARLRGWVAFKGHIAVVKLLLEHSADENIRDNAGFSPVENTVRRNHPDVMSIFLKRNKDSSLLSHLLERAVRSCQEDIASNLLDAGAPIDGHLCFRVNGALRCVTKRMCCYCFTLGQSWGKSQRT
jgi:hypothetical protein